MHKILLSILFLCMMFNTSWAQMDYEHDEQSEEFNRKLDSIQETLDDEFDATEDEYEDAEYASPSPPPPSTYDDAGNNEDAYEEPIVRYKPELREVDKSEWERLKKDKRFKYKKKKPKKQKKKKEKKERKPWFDGLGDFFNSGFFKLLLYLLLAAFLGYIVYLFIKNNSISFKKNVKDEQITQEDPWEDVQHFEDWELALNKALQNEDYRLATRIYYLHTLHLLDKQQIVKYRDDKTNWYYVQKIFGSDLHDDFMELTKSFDYIWYGEYQISKEQFSVLQSQFQNFHARII